MLDDLQKALVEALQDEYKARATYRLVISEFGEIRPFTNIKEESDIVLVTEAEDIVTVNLILFDSLEIEQC
ncbi:MAG: hypothetical protein QNJ55_29670 [Xenococcus sp. MO_188.B8]|nr:hypothetical protein [Xenococcus sp. MO_188.B8]